VVQPGRGPGLALEAEPLPGVERAARQDLEGHAPAEGNLFRLVDDAHAAAADLAQDAVIAQPLQRRRGLGLSLRLRVDLPGLLHLDQGREQVLDVAGHVGIAIQVLG
jgi:hypothetical protein